MKKTKVALIAGALLGAMALSTTAAIAGEPADVAAAPKPVVATFEINGERFKVKFTEAADIERSHKVLAGTDEGNPHPIGTIRYGKPDVNTGYSWHLSPVNWTDMSTEVCDGVPSDVEKHAVTSDYYCPWGAKLIALN